MEIHSSKQAFFLPHREFLFSLDLKVETYSEAKTATFCTSTHNPPHVLNYHPQLVSYVDYFCYDQHALKTSILITHTRIRFVQFMDCAHMTGMPKKPV